MASMWYGLKFVLASHMCIIRFGCILKWVQSLVEDYN